MCSAAAAHVRTNERIQFLFFFCFIYILDIYVVCVYYYIVTVMNFCVGDDNVFVVVCTRIYE